jgi:serine protease inhibitor
MLGTGSIDSTSLFEQVQAVDTALRASGTYCSYSALLYRGIELRPSFGKIANEVVAVHPASQWRGVNAEVSRLTNGLISSVLQREPENGFVLLCAVYFMSRWRKSFSPAKPGSFRGSTGARPAQMMSASDTVRYTAGAFGEAIELDYQDGEFCMGILLPSSAFQLGDLARFDMSGVQPQRVTYTVPRFTQRTRVDLTAGYRQLGIQQLFSRPELPYITTGSGTATLHHEAVIVVNETGTEAAAVTVYTNRALAAAPTKSLDFVADRAFYYYIKHRPTETVIFTGHYA